MDSDDDLPPQLVAAVAPSTAESPRAAPVPVTILTGFLGAGKTTLLNRLLKGAHGRRIAVVENEFGPGLDIESLIARDGLADYQLDQAQDAKISEAAAQSADGASVPTEARAAKAAQKGGTLTRLVELANGCICCSVKDGLVAALEMLVSRQPPGLPLHHIVVETSGLAQPGPVAGLFWLDDALECRVRLDGIVTVVDAYHLPKNLALGGAWRGFSGSRTSTPGYAGEAGGGADASDEGASSDATCAAQVAYADRIVLNKIDLIAASGFGAGGSLGGGDSGERGGIVEGKGQPEETVAGLLATLRLLNPLAEVRLATRADVEVAWVLDVGAYAEEGAPLKPWQQGQQHDADRAHAAAQAAAAAAAATASLSPNGGGVGVSAVAVREAASRAHRHPLGVGSLSLVLRGREVRSVEALEAWLAPIVWGPDFAPLPAAGAGAGVGGAAAKQRPQRPQPPLPGGSDGSGGNSGGDDCGGSSVAPAPQPFGFLAPEVFRLKGVVAVAGSGLKHVVQAVHGLFEVNASSEAWGDEVPAGADSGDAGAEERCVKVVVIGKNLDRRRLELGLRACTVAVGGTDGATD